MSFLRHNDLIAKGVLILMLAAVTSCTPNKRIMESSVPVSNAEDRPVKERTFADDLESMRTAEFSYIYVIRRRDGAEIDAEDKEFINSRKPSEINRVSLSDNGKAVIFGSNFRLPEALIKDLSGRFEFEDHSKVENDSNIDKTEVDPEDK